ncbi:Dual specificity protein kinase shkC [Phytophthora ramorum]|uniref:Dual specificity protein kinase shkC n=1 Tax=Phytophthora ramorum TaxID=164328 RepID=UPI0030A506D0|nr:Dual specificity protein kinase shkC [Phytophthora ramorum]
MRPVGRSFLAVLLLAAGGRADDTTLDVLCGTQNATLSMQDANQVSFTCANGTSGNKTMMKDFQVNVEASTLNLDIQQGSILGTLNFTGTSGTPTLAYTQQLNMATLSNVYSLRFENVKFSPESVKLALPSTMKDIHFNDMTMTNLSLVSYVHALTEIDLQNTAFVQIPGILYERVYDSSMNITANLALVKEGTTLSTESLQNLRANLATEVDSSCNDTTSSMRVSPDSSTLICNTSAASPSTDASSKTGNFNSPTSIASSSSNSGSAGSANAGDSSGGISTGALVAIIVVVVVVAVVLAFFILRMHFRRKAANANAQNEATTTLMSKGDATADKGSFISNDEFLRNFRLPQSDVSLVKSVGTGRLWMGEYNSEKVIVKRVESEVTDSFVTKALMAQARSFATISHPNITNLVGVTWLAGTDFAVVTEFMDKGNLKTVLSNTDVDLDVSTKLQMCLDVALALAYLHETEQNLCAKKLSSRKVLVNSALSCKLSLFECVPSSAKLGGPGKAATYSYGMGEVAWLAPEVITRSSPMDARKNNMYAFGVLVSEIFTRVSPYQALIEEQGNTMSDVELVKRVRRQEPLVPHEDHPAFLEAPASVRQLVEQCLLYAPMSRPTAKDLVDVLHHAKEELVTNSI